MDEFINELDALLGKYSHLDYEEVASELELRGMALIETGQSDED